MQGYDGDRFNYPEDYATPEPSAEACPECVHDRRQHGPTGCGVYEFDRLCGCTEPSAEAVHNHPTDERFVVEGCPACPWPPEPSAEADAAWEAFRLDTPDPYSLRAAIVRHRPLIEAALSRPDTPPLDVERLTHAWAVLESRGWEPDRYNAAAFVTALLALANPTPETT